MKHLHTLLGALALTCGAAAWAVPARPVAVNMAQPDGTEITLMPAGDEYFHYFLTDDGEIVLRNSSGAYCYAMADESGRLVASDILAANGSQRSAAQTAYVNNIDRASICEAMQQHRQASPLMKMWNAEGIAERQSRTENTSKGIGRFPGSNHPVEGTVKGLMILVEYPDVSFYKSDEETYDYFHGLLNDEDFKENGATGSARDYFVAASNGIFTPEFDVLGPVTLPQNREYYGANDSNGNDQNPCQMVMDAIDALLEQGADFTPYDNDGDGIVENVYVLYAGVGEATSPKVEEAIWPHSYNLQYVVGGKGYKAGDVYINYYACGNELCSNEKTLDAVGTFLHEFSHVLGLPDCYNTSDAYVNYTPGEFDIMDQGCYNNNSHTPPTYSIFQRNAMGWMDLTVLDEPADIELDNLIETNEGCIVLTSSKNEFFLFENRQQKSWDKYLPYHGMLVWHIDFNGFKWNANTVNNKEDHQCIDIEEACGSIYSTSLGKRKYFFPGKDNVTSFTDETTPSMRTWKDVALETPITNIVEMAGKISFKVKGGAEAALSGIIADKAEKLEIWNMQGMKVNASAIDELPAGLYIINGEKRLIRK